MVQDLIEGVGRFKNRLDEESRRLFRELGKGQSPSALMVGCSDSRVVPNLLTSTDPGELFVLRNAGNLVPPSTTEDNSAGAAVEFALHSLNVGHIIVCGHSSCGAMGVLAEEKENETHPHLRSWLAHGIASRARRPPDTALPKGDQLSQANVLQQLENLKTYTCVQERLKTGRVALHGWWFDIANAEVHLFDQKRGRFIPIPHR